MKTHISKLDVAILREDFGFGFSRLMEYTDEEEGEKEVDRKEIQKTPPSAKHSEGSEPKEAPEQGDSRVPDQHNQSSEASAGKHNTSGGGGHSGEHELASGDTTPTGGTPTPSGEHGFGSQAGAGEIAAAAAVATGIGAAGMAVYKRFFSAAAKACGGKSGAEKTACMQQYKQKGLQAYKTSISSNASKCNKSKNPAACKEALKKKMARFG